YPSFVGGDKSNVRNTFSNASASGAIEKGVLRSKNFTLKGPMVDMSGAGWYSLVSKDYDMDVSVTFAKVPTVPVRIYGSVYDPKMQVRGANMVVETVQNAGSTMFGLVKGVLMLPAYAIQGLGNLAKGDKDDKAPSAPKKRTTVAPHKNQTGHPGQ
ncbi:AsmA-like C-terminal region-containing protein, partial [Desulfovibrio sp. OttesenSCG-928-G15]|nr:AsmA-like C-terminal region-containing protein [Desulfovibrio sp. OttesenSCG-928-G15]